MGPPRIGILTLTLFLLTFFLVIPSGGAEYTKFHYQVLGLRRNATAEEIFAAYDKATQKWLEDGKEGPDSRGRIIEIQHAYDVLSHDLRRRDYDNFDVDELEEAVREAKVLDKDESKPDVVFRLWDVPAVEAIPSATVDLLYTSFFEGVLNSTETWIVQIYSVASEKSRKFATDWEILHQRFEGVANLARVELGETQLVSLLCQRSWATGSPYIQRGVPEIVVFTPHCQRLECLVRYAGPMAWLDVEDWVATKLLRLPRILFQSPISLMTEVIQKPVAHKVKVIILSDSGVRVAPYIREAAKKHREYAVIGLVLWRKEDETFWATSLEVESAPALVFLKEPGVQPVIHYGEANSSTFRKLMEEHKTHVLPQLRSISATELGCDPAAYSRAGTETAVWYCVIVAGKPGFQLNHKRGVLREAQEILMQHLTGHTNELETVEHLVAANALRQKRLTLAWLDGEAQKHFCSFYLHGETMFEACGPRTMADDDDVPKIFMVRYEREQKDVEQIRNPNIWQTLVEEQKKLASQIVTKYNGSATASEVVAWMSEMIHEGDTAVGLPRFKGQPPPLMPEELQPTWTRALDYVSDRNDILFVKGKQLLVQLVDKIREQKFVAMVVALFFLYATAVFFKMTQATRKAAVQAPGAISPGQEATASEADRETVVPNEGVFGKGEQYDESY